MTKLCIFVGMFVVSTIGWYAGELVGFQFFGCFLLSGLGSMVGVWAGWKIAQRLN